MVCIQKMLEFFEKNFKYFLKVVVGDHTHSFNLESEQS
jgi:hypothetical protein